MKGFYIKKVSVQGPQKPPAEVIFHRGANVVTGPSDSGKSYVFSVLNYMLGRSEDPKDIPESNGYTDFMLEVSTFNTDMTYTLLRKKGTTNILVKESSIDDYYNSVVPVQQYSTKVKLERDNHISSFLLGLCGLEGRMLLKNKVKGVTQRLSISDLVKLTFIPEDRIITEASPFYFNRQFMMQLVDQSLLRLLLTGDDASQVEQKETKEERVRRLGAKLELIGEQLGNFAEKRAKLDEGIQKLDPAESNIKALDTLNEDMQQLQDEARRLTEQKNELITSRQIALEELNYTNELINRFKILQKQYQSDSDRLNFILEAQSLSGQLGDSLCPICAAPLKDNLHQHIEEDTLFQQAALAELTKIQVKKADLDATIQNLVTKAAVFQAQLQDTESQLSALSNRFEQNFNPKIAALQLGIPPILQYENIRTQMTFIDTEVEGLYREKERLEKQLSQKDPKDTSSLLDQATLSVLTKKIENRLTQWQYEAKVQVIFDTSYSVFDIVISGKSRKSNGKGKRAISYSACLLGLLDVCQEQEKNFSNLIVLDSPLTTFEEKKNQPGNGTDQVAGSTIAAFFQDLSNIRKTSQVIIFDNKSPDIKARQGIHTIEFSGDTATGRYGFFPRS